MQLCPQAQLLPWTHGIPDAHPPHSIRISTSINSSTQAYTCDESLQASHPPWMQWLSSISIEKNSWIPPIFDDLIFWILRSYNNENKTIRIFEFWGFLWSYSRYCSSSKFKFANFKKSGIFFYRNARKDFETDFSANLEKWRNPRLKKIGGSVFFEYPCLINNYVA